MSDEQTTVEPEFWWLGADGAKVIRQTWKAVEGAAAAGCDVTVRFTKEGSPTLTIGFDWDVDPATEEQVLDDGTDREANLPVQVPTWQEPDPQPAPIEVSPEGNLPPVESIVDLQVPEHMQAVSAETFDSDDDLDGDDHDDEGF